VSRFLRRRTDRDLGVLDRPERCRCSGAAHPPGRCPRRRTQGWRNSTDRPPAAVRTRRGRSPHASRRSRPWPSGNRGSRRLAYGNGGRVRRPPL